MVPQQPSRRCHRSRVEIEEERAWVRFYRQAGNAGIAAEILAQLDADPEARRSHLALYLRCRESLRAHKARTQRNRRLGRFVRLACWTVIGVPLLVCRRLLGRCAACVIAWLPDGRREPAVARVRRLARDAECVQARSDFDRQPPEAGTASTSVTATTDAARRA